MITETISGPRPDFDQECGLAIRGINPNEAKRTKNHDHITTSPDPLDKITDQPDGKPESDVEWAVKWELETTPNWSPETRLSMVSDTEVESPGSERPSYCPG